MRQILCRLRAPWCSSADKKSGPKSARARPSICFAIASKVGQAKRQSAVRAKNRNGFAMADEDDEEEKDETPEPEQRLFTLTQAERVRQELEPFLVEAMSCRKLLSGLETELTAVSSRIMLMGGVL